MKKISLQEAFESTFHNKYSFQDLIDIDPSSECKSFNINDNLVLSPSKKLRNILKFLNTFIFDHADINDRVVHSYRPQKNVYSSILEHSKNKFFFQTDISGFFPSIKTKDVNRVIEKNLSKSPILDLADYRQVILNLVTRGGSLPIGFPTSPNISNSCLIEFDNELESYCISSSLHYSRYSDDLILSTSNMEKISNIEIHIQELLSNTYGQGFQLKPSKTIYTHFGNKVKLLGLVILPNGKITIDRKIKKQIEVLFHFYRSDKSKFRQFFNKIYNGNEFKVHGQLHYINTIDPNYLISLRKKYGNLTVDTFFTRPET